MRVILNRNADILLLQAAVAQSLDEPRSFNKLYQQFPQQISSKKL